MKENKWFSNLSNYIDVTYLVKFIIILTGFYYFNLLYLGITDPKNYYSAFLDHNLNYISWLTTSILKVAHIIDRAFGIDTLITGNKIYVHKGAAVLLSYACLGFGILGFWVAFVVSHKNSWMANFFWCLSGAAIIWFINCWRIAILMLALQNKWSDNKYVDHHDMFNVVAYVMILSLMYLYTRHNRNITEANVPCYDI